MRSVDVVVGRVALAVEVIVVAPRALGTDHPREQKARKWQNEERGDASQRRGGSAVRVHTDAHACMLHTVSPDLVREWRALERPANIS